MRKQMAVTMAMVTALSVSIHAQSPEISDAEKAAELAKKLSNPIASLISVPMQYNYDEGYGLEGDGSVSRLNIQPVIPFSISEDWNLITRTIIPLVEQKDVPAKGVSESGLGDTTASLFFSPKQPTERGLIWGAGPVALLPTASEDVLGSEQWGVGPTLVMLKQEGPVTVGFLGNHLWSVAGEDERADISATFLQPFASYVFQKSHTTLGVNTESTYDWKAEAWSVPVNASIAQMLKIGPQIMQLTLGARYWAESPDGGPEDWGARAQLTFLFPK